MQEDGEVLGVRSQLGWYWYNVGSLIIEKDLGVYSTAAIIGNPQHGIGNYFGPYSTADPADPFVRCVENSHRNESNSDR